MATPMDVTPTVAQPSGQPQDVVTGLASPWSIAILDETAFVSQRETGVIVEVLSDGSLRDVGTVDDSRSRARAVSSVWPSMTRAASTRTPRDRTVIASCGSRSRADRGSYALGVPETILDGLPYAGYHNGGRIAFGPDGMLYACVGDALEGDSAQDIEALSGKIPAHDAGRRRAGRQPVPRVARVQPRAPQRAGPSTGRPTGRCSPASSDRTPGTS